MFDIFDAAQVKEFIRKTEESFIVTDPAHEYRQQEVTVRRIDNGRQCLVHPVDMPGRENWRWVERKALQVS